MALLPEQARHTENVFHIALTENFLYFALFQYNSVIFYVSARIFLIVKYNVFAVKCFSNTRVR